jgi:hypothetical protein
VKRLLVLIGCVTFCSTANATIVLSSITYAADNNTAQSTGTVSPINCTGANFVAIALASAFVDAVTQITITDSVGGNTYSHTTEANDSSTNHHGVIWYAANANVSSNMTFTATCAGGTCFIGFVVACYSGVATSSPFDVENSSIPASTSVLSVATNQITPSQNNELIIAHAATTNNSGTFPTVNGGFNFEMGSNHLSGAVANYADLIQTTASVAASTFTFTTAEDATGAIAAFKAQAAASAKLFTGVLINGAKTKINGAKISIR